MTTLDELTGYKREDYRLEVGSVGIDYHYSVEKSYGKWKGSYIHRYCYLTLNIQVEGHIYPELEVEADSIDEAIEAAYVLVNEVIPRLIERGDVWAYEWESYIHAPVDVDEMLGVIKC
jgi:hypothetical protein